MSVVLISIPCSLLIIFSHSQGSDYRTDSAPSGFISRQNFSVMTGFCRNWCTFQGRQADHCNLLETASLPAPPANGPAQKPCPNTHSNYMCWPKAQPAIFLLSSQICLDFEQPTGREPAKWNRVSQVAVSQKKVHFTFMLCVKGQITFDLIYYLCFFSFYAFLQPLLLGKSEKMLMSQSHLLGCTI